MIAQGWGAPPWADENALKLDVVMDAQSLKHDKSLKLCTLSG